MERGSWLESTTAESSTFSSTLASGSFQTSVKALPRQLLSFQRGAAHNHLLSDLRAKTSQLKKVISDKKLPIAGDKLAALAGKAQSNLSNSSSPFHRKSILAPRIASALGVALPAPERKNGAQTWKIFDKASPYKRSSADLLPNLLDGGGPKCQVSGIHHVKPWAVVETAAKAEASRLCEMRLAVTTSGMPQRLAQQGLKGKVTATGVTDLGHRHLASLESKLGDQKDNHSLSAFVSHNFVARPSWGVATSHKLAPHSTLFSRFSQDSSLARKLLLQWVCTWGGRTTVSPVAALAIGGQPQLGLNFTHLLSSNKHKSKETTPSLHFKALYSTRTSAYSVSLHAKLGELLE